MHIFMFYSVKEEKLSLVVQVVFNKKSVLSVFVINKTSKTFKTKKKGFTGFIQSKINPCLSVSSVGKGNIMYFVSRRNGRVCV